MKYERWSLGYWMLKQYVRFIDWIIHRKTILVGIENIPKKKPLVFAPNHQNALSDPMAILLHSRFQPVWLARADIFKKGMVSFILRFLKIMPVYRMRDGKEQLAKNDKTFTDSIKVLKHNRPLALFPEAAHSGKRQMLAHKKAVPRIVFQAEEKSDKNLDIHIIPIGIYYSSYWKFNRTVIVNFGNPIKVNNYLEEYKSNAGQAAFKLRDHIHKAIEPLIINIKSKKYYTDFEHIRAIYGHHFLSKQGVKYSLLHKFETDKLLSKKLDNLETEHPDKIEELVQATNNYRGELKKHNIRNWLIENNKNNLLMLGVNKIVLFLGLPLFLFGAIFNAIPFLITDFLTRKKIKDQAFWSTFFLVSGILLFPLAYLLELWAVSPLFPEISLKLLFLICLPFSCKIAFNWYLILLKTLGRGRIFFMKLFQKELYNKLKTQQTQLYAQLDKLLA